LFLTKKEKKRKNFSINRLKTKILKKEKENPKTLKVGCQISIQQSKTTTTNKRPNQTCTNQNPPVPHTRTLLFPQILTSPTFLLLRFSAYPPARSAIEIPHHVALSLAIHRSLFAPTLQVSS